MQDFITIRRLSQTMTILSSTVAPVVLILACGSLITTTSQRLTNVIERSRFLTDELKALVKTEESESKVQEVSLLFFLWEKPPTVPKCCSGPLLRFIWRSAFSSPPA